MISIHKLWRIKKVDHNTFLSESESRNLSLLYYFGGDSTFVPRIANDRDWSRHRFRQRLWSACMGWNQSDFHQFSWSSALSNTIFINEHNLFTPKADFLFLTYSCLQPTNIADIHFHSLCQAPHYKGKKTYTIVFTGQKFHLRLVIGQILISHVSKTILLIRTCAVYHKLFFFFSKLD